MLEELLDPGGISLTTNKPEKKIKKKTPTTLNPEKANKKKPE